MGARGGLLINRLIFFTHKSRVNIAWSPTIWNIAGHITEGAGLLAGRTLLRHGIGPKCVTTIGTFPLCHGSHLPSKMRNVECGVRNNNISYHFRAFKKISNPPSSPFVKRGKSFYLPLVSDPERSDPEGKGRWGGILQVF